MNEPHDQSDEPRVHCPRCGKRFRVDPSSLEGKEGGASARCSGCRATFKVRRTPEGEVEIVDPGEAASRSDAVPRRGKRRKRRPPGAAKRQTRAGPTSPPRQAARSEEPAEEAPALGSGERIGRYEIEALLARGGMGAIYRAFDPAANRHVALKVLAAGAPDEDRRRFRREVEVQGNIHHPHIMPILDSGSRGRSRYFTMELLRDPIDLARLVAVSRSGEAARDPHLRPVSGLDGLISRVVLPVCQAIYHANVREGVLHRDLKPENVLVDRNGLRPFVIDFGVCSLIERKNRRLAHLPPETPERLAGGGVRVTGTLLYMPPEQARGIADRHGDVWALGALLHHILTGAAPLAPASRATVSASEQAAGLRMLIQQAKREGNRKDIAEFRSKLAALETGTQRTMEDLQRDVLAARYLPRPPGTPKALDAIVSKAMAAEPEKRYRHALELHDDLVAWLEDRPVRALLQERGPVGGALHRGRLFLRRHRRAAALLVVALGLGAWAALGMLEGPGDGGKNSGAGPLLLRAEQALRDGRTEDARDLALRIVESERDVDGAYRLLERLDRRKRLQTLLSRAQACARAAREAFEAGDWEAGRARTEELLRLWYGTDGSEVLRRDWEGEDLRRYQEVRDVVRGGRALTLGEGVRVRAVPVAPDGRILGEGTRDLDTAQSPVELEFGDWLLVLSRGGGEAWIRVAVLPGRDPLVVDVPEALARVPAGRVYVEGGKGRGPRGEAAVGPLVWEATEVTAARYAAFLDSLPAEERAQRVPRLPGAPGQPDLPLWDLDDDRFVPPPDAARRPVEHISLHDAQAFAKHAGARLPTAAEWAWAACGGDGRLCPLGPVQRLTEVRIADAEAGPADVGSTPADRSPYGLWDMAGNLAEYTDTLAAWRGTTGWLVMGGGYATSHGRALVTDADAVPGWLPLAGVGFRVVYEP